VKTLLDITAVAPGQTADVLVPLSADGDEVPPALPLSQAASMMTKKG
jgi:hypothetical protein